MPHVYVLLAASLAVTQELYLDEKTIPHVYVIVSRIYSRLFLYLMNSKSDATYTRTYMYLLMRNHRFFYVYLRCSFAVWVCTLKPRQPWMKELYTANSEKVVAL